MVFFFFQISKWKRGDNFYRSLDLILNQTKLQKVHFQQLQEHTKVLRKIQINLKKIFGVIVIHNSLHFSTILWDKMEEVD